VLTAQTPRTLTLPPWVTGYAAFYGDTGKGGAYRYTLSRSWEEGHGTVNVVMLNPSTATHEVDDPTIRRCTEFARRWGYRRLVVTNLFAYRATDPRELWRAADPVGPENDWHLGYCVRHEAERVVLAWGANGVYLGRDKAVLALLAQHWPLCAEPVQCFGVTKGGQPRHPLYVAAATPLQPYKEGK
jgi:hypothetical protein